MFTVYLHRLARRRGLIFPRLPRNCPPAFDESFASGYSATKVWQQLGGARWALRVTVVGEEAWIRPWPFALIGIPWGLTHRFRVDQITRAERVDELLANVALEYGTPDGGWQSLRLRLRNPDGFLDAIGRHPSPHNVIWLSKGLEESPSGGP